MRRRLGRLLPSIRGGQLLRLGNHVVAMSVELYELNDSLRGKMRILEDLNFTIMEKTKIEEKFEEVHGTNRKLEEKIKRMEEEKMNMELQLADIVDAYQKKMDARRTKMKKFKQHAIEKDMHLHYALEAIAILVIIIFAMYGISLCTR